MLLNACVTLQIFKGDVGRNFRNQTELKKKEIDNRWNLNLESWLRSEHEKNEGQESLCPAAQENQLHYLCLTFIEFEGWKTAMFSYPSDNQAPLEVNLHFFLLRAYTFTVYIVRIGVELYLMLIKNNPEAAYGKKKGLGPEQSPVEHHSWVPSSQSSVPQTDRKPEDWNNFRSDVLLTGKLARAVHFEFSWCYIKPMWQIRISQLPSLFLSFSSLATFP